MSIAYVIHCDADLDFVKRTLLRSLPCHGFDRWVSSYYLAERHDLTLSVPEVMAACGVILAVISRSAAESVTVREEIGAGRASPTPVIVIQAEHLTETDRAQFPNEVWLLPLLDLSHPDSAERMDLADLLPPAHSERTEIFDVAQPIEWNEEIFSEALSNVIKLHDHHQTQTLIATFTQQIKRRPYSYPAEHANSDLGMLRRERQFNLMQRYAEAVIASGTRNEKVRKQYAQSLIEQRSFDQALEVLNSIVADPKSDPNEVAEAYGLIGRTYKQQYVDEPRASGSHELLRRAIEAYHNVYAKDPSKVWHGVNTASCIVRAHRDGVEGVQLAQAKVIAEHLLKEIDRLEQTGKAEVWDYASRVEAMIVLERYEAASVALDQYLSHPDMHAFEVSSTYRQFDELLQLDQDPRGRPILARLWEAVQRHRGIGFAEQEPAFGGSESPETRTVGRPLLIRVADPEWEPKEVTDLVPQARMGTIVSALGSDASVKELLGDPNVIAINDSVSGGTHDCEASIPFIRVTDNYPGPRGEYQEKGAGALIAIIDNGIDVLHQAFLDANGKSRIVGIWDQTDVSGQPPAGFDFGTYHSETEIARYIHEKETPKSLGRNRNGEGHGTHVASIAAGRKVGAFAGGVAPEARLLIVIADGQSPIGYSTSHVTALAFIDKIANELKMPVVVNVSQGLNAGAHDGRSMLEVAFDAFAEGGRKPGRVIVKSAGNERHKNGHAKVTMGSSAEEELRWLRNPRAALGERLELWWNSADEFEFRLGDPSGNWTKWVGNTNQQEQGDLAGTPYLIEFTRRHIDNGDSQLRIKIGEAVAPIATGTWRLEIRSGRVLEGGEIHAWIERGGGVPSSFENHMNEEMTLSVPGTAQSIITVGAIEIMADEATIRTRVGRFSSYGPTRDQRNKPEVAAPGVGVRAAKAGTESNVVSMDGTSMAAPHVTGAIALLLSRMALSEQTLPTASQINSALRQKTINYNGHWDRGQGFGIVDVAALLAAF